MGAVVEGCRIGLIDLEPQLEERARLQVGEEAGLQEEGARLVADLQRGKAAHRGTWKHVEIKAK